MKIKQDRFNKNPEIQMYPLNLHFLSYKLVMELFEKINIYRAQDEVMDFILVTIRRNPLATKEAPKIDHSLSFTLPSPETCISVLKALVEDLEKKEKDRIGFEGS